MTNLEAVQKFGKQSIESMNNGTDKITILIGIAETNMELLAAILDELVLIRKESEVRKGDENG